EAVEAGPPSAAYRLRKLAQKHRGYVGAAAAVAATLLFGLAASLWQAARATRAEGEAQRRLQSETVALGTAKKSREEAERERDRATRAEGEAQRRLQSETVALGKAKKSREEAERERDRAQIAEQNAKRLAKEARAAETKATEYAEIARQEVNISKAITTFLHEDLLDAGDGGDSPEASRDLKLVTVLNRASAKLGERYKDQPGMEAGIRLTIGNSYWSLHELEAAQTHLVRAAQLFQQYRGQEHPDTLRAINSLAVVLLEQREYGQAERLHRHVLELQRKVFGNEHPETMLSMANLAFALERLNRLDAAEALLKEAVETRIRVRGEKDPETTVAMNNLAVLHEKKGDYEAAERWFRRRLAILEKTAPQSASAAAAKLDLAGILAELDRHEEVE
ncbi:MAG: tetratricopeptide repeat protein, partial [Planctomycetales bacterium]